MEISKAKSYIDAAWSDSILPQLIEYVRIPNKSPLFDPDWETHGHMEAAVQLMLRWAQAEAPAGLAYRGAATAGSHARADGGRARRRG